MKCMLEHANLTVRNIEESLRFITTAFPHWKVRGGGGAGKDRWVHIGTDETYIALGESKDDPKGNFYEGTGVNHLGYVVDDAEGVKKRLLAAGFKEGFKPTQHPNRLRVYIFDPDGMEWEFVQYYSDDPKLKNDYSQ
ncbi:MAG: VOC family protein [Planctomycetes bacterium]|nr:VOC family protein [Planctomycetota bacterium]